VEARMLVRRVAAGCLALAMVHASSTAIAAEPTKDECINANEEAQTLRKAGKLRTAREDLLLCTAPTCPGPVRVDCAQQLGEVEAALPTLVLEVRSEASGVGGDVTTVRATMDGAPLEGALDGRAIALDPGPHTFVFEAEGFLRTEVHLVLREGDKLRRERVSLSLAPKDSSPEPPLPPPNLLSPAAKEPETKPAARPGAAAREAGYAALGLGAAGVVVGAIFGILALENKSALAKSCPEDACPPAAQGDLSAFRRNGLGADMGFGAGAAGLVAGGVLLVVSGGHHPAERSRGHVAPWVGFGRAGVGGTFE
jgi:hypothetical protein